MARSNGFFGILLEHFAGKFPLWMAPVQVGILPINDDLIPFAKDTAARLERAGLRTEIDQRSESLKKKVRDAQPELYSADSDLRRQGAGDRHGLFEDPRRPGAPGHPHGPICSAGVGKISGCVALKMQFQW